MKKNDIKKMIVQAIEQEEKYIVEHNAICEILKQVDGKPFNKITFNEKKIKPFRFKTQYGMFYLIGEYEHLVGHSGSVVNADNFNHLDICHGGAAQERIEQLKNLNVEKVYSVFNNIEKHFNEICFLFGDLEAEKLGSFYNPLYYELLKSIHNEDNKYGIELYKFSSIRKKRGK